MANFSNYKAWIGRISYINGEYPFGPVQYKRDVLKRLHCETGPAYISPTRCTWYKEGRKHGLDVDIFGSMTYYYENILVPSRWMLKPESITFDEIVKNKNQELRYVGLRVYGLERAKNEGKFKVVNVDKNKSQELLRCKLGDITVQFVSVLNSSPEPDGSYKRYYLCVPPNINTCKEAVAWTFGKEEKDYNPIQET